MKSTNTHGQRREAFPFHRIQHRWDGHTNLDAVHAVAATISKGPVEDGKMHCHAAAVVIKWLIINLKTGIRHGFNARGEIQVTQHRGILGQLVKCFFCYSSSAQVEPPQLEVGLKKQTLLDPWWNHNVWLYFTPTFLFTKIVNWPWEVICSRPCRLMLSSLESWLRQEIPTSVTARQLWSDKTFKLGNPLQIELSAQSVTRAQEDTSSSTNVDWVSQRVTRPALLISHPRNNKIDNSRFFTC